MSEPLDEWEIQDAPKLPPFRYWEKKRIRFNWFLLPSIIIGCLIGLALLKSKWLESVEDTLVSHHYFEYLRSDLTTLHIGSYFLLIIVFNVLYSLLFLLELLSKPKQPEQFRNKAFKIALIIIIPLPIIISFYI